MNYLPTVKIKELKMLAMAEALCKYELPSIAAYELGISRRCLSMATHKLLREGYIIYNKNNKRYQNMYLLGPKHEAYH